MQEEVQKALKIHRANKELNSKNSLLKKEMERLQHEHKAEIQQHQTIVDTLNQQNEQLKVEIKRKSSEASQMLIKITEQNREQPPSKQALELQSEKERLMERVEDLEGRLNREQIDYKETINELKLDKEDLSKSLDEA